jgi:hypothetical protein
MKIGSLCTGYGGLDMAVEAYFDGETVWVSEIDKYASQVIDQRIKKFDGNGKSYGDTIDGHRINYLDSYCKSRYFQLQKCNDRSQQDYSESKDRESSSEQDNSCHDTDDHYQDLIGFHRRQQSMSGKFDKRELNPTAQGENDLNDEISQLVRFGEHSNKKRLEESEGIEYNDDHQRPDLFKDPDQEWNNKYYKVRLRNMVQYMATTGYKLLFGGRTN